MDGVFLMLGGGKERYKGLGLLEYLFLLMMLGEWCDYLMGIRYF